MIDIEDYDDDVMMEPDLLLRVLRAVTVATLVAHLGILAGMFIATGNPVALAGALLAGFVWARL